MDEDKDFLRQDNNYRTLKAFQKAECIYDVTYYFANTFLKVGDRTIDQMVQAARSGKQNLAEGNIANIAITLIHQCDVLIRMHRGDPAVHFWTDSNGDSEVARQTQDHSSGLHRCGPEMIVLQNN